MPNFWGPRDRPVFRVFCVFRGYNTRGGFAARLDYIRELWDYQRAVGVVSLANRELLPEPSRLDNLRRLVKDWWQTTLDLVAEAKGSAK